MAAVEPVIAKLWSSPVTYDMCDDVFARLEASYVGMVDAVTSLLNRHAGGYPDAQVKHVAAELSSGLPTYLVRRWALSHISCPTQADRAARNKTLMKAIGFMHAARADLADMLISVANVCYECFKDTRANPDVSLKGAPTIAASIGPVLSAYWLAKDRVLAHVRDSAVLQEPLTYSFQNLSGFFLDGVISDEKAWIVTTADGLALLLFFCFVKSINGHY